jgi:hypothetical protein
MQINSRMKSNIYSLHTKTHPLCSLTHSYTWTHMFYIYTQIILFTYVFTNAHIFNTLFYTITRFAHTFNTLFETITHTDIFQHTCLHTLLTLIHSYTHILTRTYVHTPHTNIHSRTNTESMYTFITHHLTPYTHTSPHTQTLTVTNIPLIDTKFTY